MRNNTEVVIMESSSKKEYKLFQGNYVLIDEKTNEVAQND